MSNLTEAPVFVLRGFSSVPTLRLLSAAVLLPVYLVATLGNFSIVAAVTLDVRLHTPMYFLLQHLSLADVCSISSTLPWALVATALSSAEMSRPACALQLFAFTCFGSTECFLITAMAYDRCLAIYRPLVYGTAMRARTYVSLAVAAWASGLLFSTFHTANTFSLPFCGPKVIDHFFCDIPALLRLACAHVAAHEAAGLAVSGCVVMSCFVLTVLSYARILVTVLAIRAASGRRKAFSTCSSHLATVLLFYGTGSSAYMQPPARYSALQGRVAAVCYAVLTPTLNPLIYSLRNKDVQRALRKLCLHVLP